MTLVSIAHAAVADTGSPREVVLALIISRKYMHT